MKYSKENIIKTCELYKYMLVKLICHYYDDNECVTNLSISGSNLQTNPVQNWGTVLASINTHNLEENHETIRIQNLSTKSSKFIKLSKTEFGQKSSFLEII